MKLLLEITRSQRAERPSEFVITSDSQAMVSGNFGAVTQDISKDNYLIIDAPNGIDRALITVLARMQTNPAKLQAGDGWRALEYPQSDKWTLASDLRPGSKAQVQVLGENSFEWFEYATIDQALAKLSLLDQADGYVLVDESPDNDTQVISSRPALWKTEAHASPCAEQANTHGRADTDRH